MEENTTTQQAAQPQGCPGDCKKCRPTQQVYCAAQTGLYNVRFISELTSQVSEIAEKVKVLEELSASLLKLTEEIRDGVRTEMPELISAPVPEEDTRKKKKK